MKKWNDLSMYERTKYLNEALKYDITDLNYIRQLYDTMQDQFNVITPTYNLVMNSTNTTPNNYTTNRFDKGGNTKKPSTLDLIWDSIKSKGKEIFNDVTEYLSSPDLNQVYNTPNAGEQAANLLNTYYDVRKQREIDKLNIGSFVKEGDEYYRVNSDLTHTKVTKGDDGYFYWTDNKGRRVRNADKTQYKKLPSNINALKVAQNIALQQVDTKLDNINKLDKNGVIELQTQLAEEGYYSELLKYKSKKEIKRIQRRLNIKVDGIVGTETKNAFTKSQIDGIVGRNTRGAALLKFKNNGFPEVEQGLDGCAQFVTSVYESQNGLTSKQNGVIGNAWEMPMNIVNKGGTMKYNLYEDPKFKNVKNVADLKQTTLKASKQNPLDYKKVQVGDIVGIYIPSSDMHKVALKDGTTKNTHIGYVVGTDKDGMPLIRHNIHTSYRTDRADAITGSRRGNAFITTVTTPKVSILNVPELLFTPKESRLEVTNKKGKIGKDFQKVLNGMEGAVDIFQQMFPNIDVEKALISTVAVQQRETDMGAGRVSDLIEQPKHKITNDIRTLARKIKGESKESKSSNQMKMKFTSLLPYERKMLGIGTPEDLEDPYKAGVAALYQMCKNMDYFTRLQQTYPDLGITDDDIESLTMLSYNQGMSKLSNIGFRNDTNTAALGELDYIRSIAKEDARIKDISATNFKYLNSLGQFIYDNFGDTFQPYIASAKEAKKRIKVKK